LTLLIGRLKFWHWTVVAGSVLLTLAAGYGLYLTAMARDVRQKSAAFQEHARLIVRNQDSAGIHATLAELDSLLPPRASLDRALLPVKAGAVVFGWVPGVGDNLRAARSFPEQAYSQVAAVRSSLVALRPVLDAYQGFASGADPIEQLKSGSFQKSLASASEGFSEARVFLSNAARAGAEVHRAKLLGPIRTVQFDLDARLSDIQGLVSLGSETVAAVSDAARTLELAEAARSVIASPAAALRDTGRTMRLLSELAEASGSANGHVHAALVAAPAYTAGTGLEELLTTLETLTASLKKIGSATFTVLDTIEPSVERLRAEKGPIFSSRAFIEAMVHLKAGRATLEDALSVLDEGISLLDQMSGNKWLGSSAGELQQVSARAKALGVAVKEVAELAEIAPALMGAGGRRSYLVLGLTSDELRATGGFVSSLWRVDYEDGVLTGVRYLNVGEVDAADKLATYPDPPRALRVNMNAGALYMRDVGWDPDFPATAETAREVFELGTGEKVGGVVALTQWGFLSIIQLLGGVQTVDGFIPPEQLMSFMESKTDKRGTVYLETLMDGLLAGFSSQALGSDPVRFGQGVRSMITSKQVLIHVFDREDQAALDRLGWNGAFPIFDGDRLAIVDSNIGWTKADRNITRSAQYSVDLSDPGKPLANLFLSYSHKGEGSDTCLEQAPPPAGKTHEDLKNGCYWNLLRVYPSLGATLKGTSKTALPAGSVAARVWGAVPGSDTVQTEFDVNGTFFSSLLSLAPGATITTSFGYQLDGNVVQLDGQTLGYNLTIWAQPGALSRDVTVDVRLPDGYVLGSSSIRPATVDGQTVTFKADLARDALLHLQARK
jgi:hypothetical protein